MNIALKFCLPLVIVFILESCQRTSNPISVVAAPTSTILVTDGNRLCAIDDEGKNVQVIAINEAVGSEDWEARLSPDGSLIVYCEVIGHVPKQIFLYDRGTHNTSKITNDSLFHQSPIFSPDGKSVLFLTSRNWLNDMFLFDIDSRKIIELTFGQNCYDPSYSSDGTKIIFSLNDSPDSSGVAIINKDGSNLRIVGPGENPFFFPSAQMILFQNMVSANDLGLFTMNSDGSNRKFLSIIPWQSHPTISPAGSHIVFSNFVGNFDLFLMTKDGTNLANLTKDTSAEFSPCFSKDGNSIAFVTLDTSTSYYLELMNIDGSHRRRIFEARSTLWPPTF